MKPLRGLLLLLALLPAAAGAASSAPFLWQIPTPQARHYLMGSIHLLPESAHPLPPGLGAAYEATHGLVFESDIAELSSPEVQLGLLAAARADPEEGLRGMIGSGLYARLQSQAGALGMPMELCDLFKPWFCAMTLELFGYQHAGFRSELGIDQHFYGRAMQDDKPVRWLETPAEHMQLFTDMPDSQSEQFLAATVDDLARAGQSPEDLLRIWREGDLSGLERAAEDMREHHGKAYERLLAGRNRAWIPRLVQILREPSPQLVIVGAAHLAGPDGLLALLRAQGLRVEPAPAVRSPRAAGSPT